ncbi:MAG: hypothetical protein RLN74_08440, partial [Ilumatobacter fluminis]
MAAITLTSLALSACSSDSDDADDAAPASTEASPTTDAEPDDEPATDDVDEPADDEADEPAPDDEPDTFEVAPIEWSEFDDDVDVATVTVPVDYENPGGDQFELFVARHRALDQD